MNDDVFELLKQVNRLSEKQDALRTELMERMDKINEQAMDALAVGSGGSLVASALCDILTPTLAAEDKEKLRKIVDIAASLLHQSQRMKDE